MSFLFGSAGKAPETKFTTLPNLDFGQQQVQFSLERLLQNQLGEGVSSYGGTTVPSGTYVPGASGTQSQIFDLVRELLNFNGPMQQEGMGVLKDAMQPYSDVKAKDYWTTAVKKPMMESWEKDISPDIMNQFAAYDAAGSGPAQKALAESGRRLNTDMGSILSKTLMDYENQYRNRSMDASKSALAYPESLISSLLPAANMERQITSEQGQELYRQEVQRLMEDKSNWAYEQPYNNPWMTLLDQVLNRKTFENVGYQSGGVAPQKGIFGDVLGAVTQVVSSVLGSEAGSNWLFG